MRRADFDALVAAVAATAEVVEVVVVGSQSILASFDDSELPRAATMSPEIDVVIAANPRAGSVRLMLGHGSQIDRQRGVYVAVVSEHTPHLPSGWRERAVTRKPDGSIGTAVCPDVHDLALAKIGAGRPEKDYPYVEALLAMRPPILQFDVLDSRLPEMRGVITTSEYTAAAAWLARARKRHPR